MLIDKECAWKDRGGEHARDVWPQFTNKLDCPDKLLRREERETCAPNL